MNNAPAVYVPTQPEGDGLKLPTLFSVLAHGLVIGFLIYNFQSPVLESAGSIETVMVSPEQLAEMQGQILANRAANEAAQQSSGAISNEPFNPNDIATAGPSGSTSTSQQVPVYMRSDQLSREDYEANMEAFRAETNQEALDRLQVPLDEAHQRYVEDQETLSSFKDAQNNPPKIERPTSSSRNVEITAGSSGSEGKNYSLSDGQSTTSSDSSAASSSDSSSAGDGRSKGQYIDGIKEAIRRAHVHTENTYNETVTLTINVDRSGNVKSVSATGASKAAMDSAMAAARRASPLNIDADNFDDYKVIRVTYRIPSAS